MGKIVQACENRHGETEALPQAALLKYLTSPNLTVPICEWGITFAFQLSHEE